jgi:hypothetical protein
MSNAYQTTPSVMAQADAMEVKSQTWLGPA